MKIAVCGKGGAGKTSIAYALSWIISEKNKVLAIDADASLNLTSLFGVKEFRKIINKDVLEERALKNELIIMNPKVSDLIDRSAVKINENLNFIVMGTIDKIGTGCLCPENAMLRALLQELVLKRTEYVVVDFEAGLEMMSRGTVKNIDVVLVVTEASASSVSVAEKLIKFSNDFGAKPYVVANRFNEGDMDFYNKLDFKVFHFIPYDSELRTSSMNNKINTDGEFYKSITELAEKIHKLNLS